ncbi:DEAD/DEAH box helicase [Roseovarius sp. SCSIO 43702]|uniref:DEAD/DEAH box helicase n=1 Tax=Roseovarius sp. SCSIO 43702 TaxID=2823043 RepID=UPI001C73512E|nr:DEAD/DEAH box helicase [Roseovarius sp. SCSIO 43702]QYX58059.1 DEAD/DEAH box helicase [Roseovarius sp. SCSIO 43702]
MIPRDYQRSAVDAAHDRTAEHGNTMLVLPTGSGKTAIAGFYVCEQAERDRDAKVLVLQHTDELIEQNRSAIGNISGLDTSVVKAEQDCWDGRVVFGSVQTLARVNRRETMPAISHLIIDECHRAAATSYRSVIEHVRGLNPTAKLLGLSATPGRGDGQSLRKTFSNVGYHLQIGTLIARGLLVPPRTFTIDLGIEDELSGIDSTAGDFNMRQAGKVLNRSVLNETVVEHWKDKAADRRTILFCSTVDHAEAVADAFRAEGVTAEPITGEMPTRARADLIARFDSGEVQVLTNCMVLTEGFDSQPVGCIGILRPMLHKGTFIQAVGRGLRRVDPERFPGIIKTDCTVLDFAGAALRHGTLEQDIGLDDDEKPASEHAWKTCPSCEAELPLGASVCDFCGHVFTRVVNEKRLLTSFEMTEIDLLDRSPFSWCDLHGDGQALMASGFQGWAGVFHDGTLWHALGNPKAKALRTLAVGTRVQALAAADDFLRATETSSASAKSKRWLNDPATLRQIELLQRAGHQMSGMDFGLSKYAANCHLNFRWQRSAIRAAVLRDVTRSVA